MLKSLTCGKEKDISAAHAVSHVIGISTSEPIGEELSEEENVRITWSEHDFLRMDSRS